MTPAEHLREAARSVSAALGHLQFVPDSALPHPGMREAVRQPLEEAATALRLCEKHAARAALSGGAIESVLAAMNRAYLENDVAEPRL